MEWQNYLIYNQYIKNTCVKAVDWQTESFFRVGILKISCSAYAALFLFIFGMKSGKNTDNSKEGLLSRMNTWETSGSRVNFTADLSWYNISTSHCEDRKR